MAKGQTVYIEVDRQTPPEGHQHQRCKRCPYWYGAEDDEYGPCSLKTARGWDRFLTFGEWACDEGLVEPVNPDDPDPPTDEGALDDVGQSADADRSTAGGEAS